MAQFWKTTEASRTRTFAHRLSVCCDFFQSLSSGKIFSSLIYFILYFSRHIHDALLDIAYDFSQTSGNTVIFEKMTATLAKLAEAEKTTLEALIGFLRSVAGDAETNLMTVENLGLVLGPTLMKLPEPMTTVIILIFLLYFYY